MSETSGFNSWQDRLAVWMNDSRLNQVHRDQLFRGWSDVSPALFKLGRKVIEFLVLNIFPSPDSAEYLSLSGVRHFGFSRRHTVKQGNPLLPDLEVIRLLGHERIAVEMRHDDPCQFCNSPYRVSESRASSTTNMLVVHRSALPVCLDQIKNRLVIGSQFDGEMGCRVSFPFASSRNLGENERSLACRETREEVSEVFSVQVVGKSDDRCGKLTLSHDEHLHQGVNQVRANGCFSTHLARKILS